MTEISSMNGQELIKEIVLLTKIREDLEILMIHNADLKSCIIQIDKDIKQVSWPLLLKYHTSTKVDLNSLEVSNIDIRQRMIKYLGLAEQQFQPGTIEKL